MKHGNGGVKPAHIGDIEMPVFDEDGEFIGFETVSEEDLDYDDDTMSDFDAIYGGDMYVGDILFGDAPVTKVSLDGGERIPNIRGTNAKFGSFLKKARNTVPGKGLSSKIKKLSSQVAPASSRAGKLETTRMIETVKGAIEAIPGAAARMKTFSPVIVSGGELNDTPTRALIPGALFVQSLERFETQYPSTTRTITLSGVSGDQPVTFAAPVASQGGETLYSSLVFINIAMQRQTSVAAPQIGVSLSGVNNGGSQIDDRVWSIVLNGSTQSTFIAMIPFVEVASAVYPSIAEASAANNLVVNLYGLPAGSQVRVMLPTMNSSQYQLFKQGFAISRPNESLLRL